MIRVRTTKTASGKTAVQAVSSTHKKTLILKHLGSAETEKEISHLTSLGKQFIENQLGYNSLFPEFSTNNRRVQFDQLLDSAIIKTTRHLSVYQILVDWYNYCGFGLINNSLLCDLSIIRLIEPTSKLQSIKLLARHFLKKYSEVYVYRQLPKLGQFKAILESVAIAFAKAHYNFSFSLVFYDVTTLYFESFTPDELRKCGFSKDSKSNQPQIVIGLVVDHQGFPISYGLFEGNTFEGHTMIPVILELKKKYQIDDLIIVADAGMISFANFEKLNEQNLNYIVGARVKNLPINTIKLISTSLNKTENKYFSLVTKHGRIVCDYSKKRATKDKGDRLKQLTKAKFQLDNPNTALRRNKFVKTISSTKLSLNQGLIDKSELLDGIKGYCTNTNIDDQLIVSRYHDLWHVEKSFRIAKSDLLARPIFHFKRASIEAHLLIIFISLCLAKSLELATGLSIKKITDLLWLIEDIEIQDKQTLDIYHKQTVVESPELEKLLSKIKSAY
jgi:transposase